MGVVYRARDRQLGRDIALKLVHTDDDPDETLAARLMREAQALAQLSHPNVVAVYDVGRTEGGVFFAMELVTGETGDSWLRERRPWRTVVRVFCDAARGLAAAHAVGLVHRDFKPSNVILGADGRTRVLDFGLARAAGGSAPPTLSDSADIDSDDQATRRLEDLEPAASVRSLLDVALTRDGAIVGTPQYMAPEQFRGSAYDARTDQFSFCIALYKALYGVRPFEGKTFGELRRNVLAGKIRPLPDNDVPGWVRDCVLRGLSIKPEDRWPSMEPIIEILSRDPGTRKRRVALAAAAIVLVGAGGVAAWMVARRDPGAMCKSSARDLAGVWDAPRKAALASAFGRTGKPFAQDALAAVDRVLDGYTTRWAAMRTEACEATHVEGTQSAQLLDLRMACLHRRLHDVRAVVDILTAADADVVARAPELASQLPPLEPCADSEALSAPVPRPTDPALAARVDKAQRTLATVNALADAGRYADARAQLAPLRTEATALGWRPLEGEVLLAAARLSELTGAYQDALELFKDAAVAAEAGRDDATAALARNGLVWVTGERLGRYGEAQDLAREAEAKVERLGNRGELIRADLDAKMSALLVEQARFAEAEQRSRHALEIRQKNLPPDDPAIASSLGDLADVLAETSRWDDAIPYYRKALAVAEHALGPDHSHVASLRINLASALRYKGDTAGSLAELAKARTITERALGPEHPQLATIALDTGTALLDTHKPAEALAQFERARDLWTRTLGADHPNVGTAEYKIGEVALAEGHPDDAIRSYQRALDIWQTKLGPDHPSLASALDGLARAQLARKQPAAALAFYERALALLEKSLPHDSEELAGPLAGIATCDLALGKPTLARAPLERALALREHGTDATELARVRALLDQVHAALKH
jgi:tetratricopeptide (TPR) repeat protein